VRWNNSPLFRCCKYCIIPRLKESWFYSEEGNGSVTTVTLYTDQGYNFTYCYDANIFRKPHNCSSSKSTTHDSLEHKIFRVCYVTVMLVSPFSTKPYMFDTYKDLAILHDGMASCNWSKLDPGGQWKIDFLCPNARIIMWFLMIFLIDYPKQLRRKNVLFPNDRKSFVIQSVRYAEHYHPK